MTDNKKIAEQVLAAVGGAANLKDATHCMTRLRLYLKDDSLPKDDEVKKISGVLGVVRGGQQYQIVIGTNVPKVYEELCKLAGISASAAVKDDAAAAEDAAITKRKLTPKQVGKNIMGYLAGCMTPMIPVLLAGGLFRAVNSIFGPDLLGLYTLESNLYILFDFLYDAAFYFMPILVGYNAAKQLGVNGMLGSFIGSVLMVPDFAAFATNGQTFTVFGIPATVTNYAQTVLPVMLSVPLFCLVYKTRQKVHARPADHRFHSVPQPAYFHALYPLPAGASGHHCGQRHQRRPCLVRYDHRLVRCSCHRRPVGVPGDERYAPGPDDAHDGRFL